MIRRLQARLMLAVVVVGAIGIALSAYLNFAKFESTFSDIEASRFRFISADIARTLVREMDFGIDLARISEAERFLERALKQEPRIVTALIFDAGGTILFQVGRPMDAAPGDWMTALRASETGRIWAELPDRLVVAEQLVNNFGMAVGAVAVVYSRSTYDFETAHMASVLLVAALFVLLVAILTAYVGVWWAIRPAGRRLASIEAALEQKRNQEGVDGDLAAQVAAADAEMVRAIHDIEEVQRTLPDGSAARN